MPNWKFPTIITDLNWNFVLRSDGIIPFINNGNESFEFLQRFLNLKSHYVWNMKFCYVKEYEIDSKQSAANLCHLVSCVFLSCETRVEKLSALNFRLLSPETWKSWHWVSGNQELPPDFHLQSWQKFQTGTRWNISSTISFSASPLSRLAWLNNGIDTSAGKYIITENGEISAKERIIILCKS